MATKTQPKFQALGLNNGLITHLGSFASVDEAETAVRQWFEQGDKNISGWTFFVIEGQLVEL